MRAEVRYLKRRRLIPRRTNGNDEQETAESSTSAYRRGGSSPASVVSQFLIIHSFILLFSRAAILRASNIPRENANLFTNSMNVHNFR